jgi:transposase
VLTIAVAEIAKLGHAVRLIAPAYVKPFFKRPSRADGPRRAAINASAFQA